VRFAPTPLDGVWVVETEPSGDERGWFARTYDAELFRAQGLDPTVVQCNASYNARRDTLRGMHFQAAPHAETKLVRCATGAIFDVAVDLRAGSPTFGRWHAERLSADNDTALLIPRGCAHGFQALTDDAELLYVHSAAYAADAEGGVDALDPRLAIAWPFPPGEMSARDRGHPRIDAGFEGLAP